MNRFDLRLLSLPFAVLAAASAVSLPARAVDYGIARILPIGGVGGWDYVTVDAKDGLLFVPRTTHTQVIDLGAGKVVADIAGQKHNHGVAIVRSANRGFISDGEGGSVFIFDLKTDQVLGKIAVDQDADGIIYDPSSDRVLVVCGDAGTMIPISPHVDPAAGKADPAIDLGGKPEFLVSDGLGRVYVNLVDKGLVAVVDTKTMAVRNRWPTSPGGSPVGMSMDRAHRRLYVGCRKPQLMIVMNADDGSILASLPIGAGVDATRFDGEGFASCRDGTLTVVGETAPGKFAVLQSVATKPGARTMDVDLETRMIYLPTAEYGPPPAGGGRPAVIPGTFMIVAVGR
jgi:DNA-binding beta-propeller fold protein YncE